MGHHIHTRRNFIKTAAAAAMGLGYFSPGIWAEQANSNRPNILFIYLDDLGYGDVSCYNPKSKIHTPNIDRIAREGLIFTDAHTPAAICGPSRYGLMTGRYPWRARGGTSNGPPFRDMWIEEDRMTVASLLEKQGYNTSQAGKWGIRHNYADALKDGAKLNNKTNKDSFDFPDKRLLGANLCGFDHSFAYVHLSHNKNRKYAFENGLPVDAELKDYDPHRWLPDSAMKVVEFLEVQGGIRENPSFKIDRSQPFFVYWDPPSPHTPIVPNKEFLGKSNAGEYGDFVVEIDHYVGKILDTLDKLNLSDNTLVILSSDNGPEKIAYERIRSYKHYSMGSLRGVKRDTWEGGHRTPLIVRWPAVVKPGGSSDAIVCLTDWLATIADITGQKLPDNAGEDSISILPILRDANINESLRESVIHHTPRGRFAIRDKEWVYIDHKTGDANREPAWFRKERGVHPHSFPAELFNLKTDPQQTNNLYAEYPEKVKEMKALLEQRKKAGRSRMHATADSRS